MSTERRKRKQLFFIYSIVFFWFLPILGQCSTWQSLPGGFSASIDIQNPHIELNEELKIELTASFPKNYALDLDTLRSNLIHDPGFGILPFHLTHIRQSQSEEWGQITQKLTFILEPQLAGKFPISFMNIPFLPQDNKKDKKEILSDLFQITVSEGPKATINASMIAPVFFLPFEYPLALSQANSDFIQQQNKEWASHNLALYKARLFPWKECLFIVGMLGACLLAFTRKKELPPPEVTARNKALKALEKLKSTKITDQNREQHYIALVDIVRVYIEERYSLQAPKLTTEEFLSLILDTAYFDPDTHALLKQFLHHADQVKFAKHVPSQEEWDKAFQIALQFVG